MGAYLIGAYVGGAGPGGLLIFEAVMLSFPFCFFLFGVNDLYDIETDRINQRKGNAVWGQVLGEGDRGWINKWSAIVICIMLLGALASGNVAHVLATAGYIIFVYTYSAPPIRLKSFPVVDSLVNACYFLGPFAMGYSLEGSYGFLNPQFVLFSLTFSGGHAIAAIADYNEDMKAGIRTFATAFGSRVPALFALGIFLANAPFAFSVVKSTGLVLAAYALIAALLIFKPEYGKKAVSATVAVSLIWAAYFAVAFFLGIESISIPK